MLKKVISGQKRKMWALLNRISLGIKLQLKLETLSFSTIFAQKGYFWLKIEKVNSIIEFCNIRIKLDTKIQLKLTILTFWTKFPPKEHFQSKTERVSIVIEYCIFELFWVPNLSLNWQSSFFGPNFLKKSISGMKGKSDRHHWILNVRISLGIKFHCKLTISIFWTKFPQNVFPVENEKMNSIIEFCIFELG